MPDQNSERVTCPDCGKGYRWQDKLVGRVVPCKQCSTPFTVPGSPGVGTAYEPEPPTNDDGTYDLDVSEDEGPSSLATPALGGKCPSCNSPVKEHAVLCMNCGFNMKEGKKMQTAVAEPVEANHEQQLPLGLREQRDLEAAADAHREHQWIDYKLPIILIIIGCLMVLINNVLLAPNAPTFSATYGSTGQVVLALTIDAAYSTFVNCVLLFTGLFLLVWLFGSSFGAVGSVLLKILAISLVAQEVDFMVVAGFDIMTGAGLMATFFSWFIYIGLMIILCIKLLDVDATEFRVLIVFIIIGHVAADFTADILLGMIF